LELSHYYNFIGNTSINNEVVQILTIEGALIELDLATGKRNSTTKDRSLYLWDGADLDGVTGLNEESLLDAMRGINVPSHKFDTRQKRFPNMIKPKQNKK
jgi:hypothetical protein